MATDSSKKETINKAQGGLSGYKKRTAENRRKPTTSWGSVTRAFHDAAISIERRGEHPGVRVVARIVRLSLPKVCQALRKIYEKKAEGLSHRKIKKGLREFNFHQDRFVFLVRQLGEDFLSGKTPYETTRKQIVVVLGMIADHPEHAKLKRELIRYRVGAEN